MAEITQWLHRISIKKASDLWYDSSSFNCLFVVVISILPLKHASFCWQTASLFENVSAYDTITNINMAWSTLWPSGMFTNSVVVLRRKTRLTYRKFFIVMRSTEPSTNGYRCSSEHLGWPSLKMFAMLEEVCELFMISLSRCLFLGSAMSDKIVAHQEEKLYVLKRKQQQRHEKRYSVNRVRDLALFCEKRNRWLDERSHVCIQC